MPLDGLLSYSHINFQNSAFTVYAPRLRERGPVGQLLTVSPLNMGLLTPTPPQWHPVPPDLKGLVVQACEGWDGGLVNIAMG